MNENEQLLRFCKALRSTRENMGFSQESFADSIGMHRAYYSCLERGEKNITFKTLCKIAAGMGEAPSSLLKKAEL